jgi:hypothetical protein
MFNIGDTSFYEKINLIKLKYIYNNKNLYKDQIEAEEKAMRRKNRNNPDSKSNVWTNIKKIIKNTIPIPNSEYGFIPVKYKKGIKSNNIGRWYSDNSIGLAPLCTCVRHTICDNIWIDIDQVNSHPTIMKSFMSYTKHHSPLLNQCFENREEFLKIIMEEEECSRDDAKTCVISVINGGKYKSKTLKQLTDELKPCINQIIEDDKYRDIYNYCRKEYVTNLSNLSGKVISRILQIIENDVLECYIEYCYDNGFIPEYKNHKQVCLIFDGFQLPYNDKIDEQFLDDMRKYAFEKTGYDVPLKLKDMDNKLEFPEDYNEAEIDEEDEEEDDFDCGNLKSYEECKKEFELTHAKILYPPSVYTIDDEDDDKLQNMKNARETHGHLKCYVNKPTSKNKKLLIIKEPKNFINKWLLDPDIKFYKSICWKPPPLISNDNMFNTWKPFDISNVTLENSLRDYVKDFLSFCENLFESKEVMNYLISRYAFRLQNPGLRTNVCVVYYGEEGGGKSTFIDTIYSLFGKYAIQIDKAKKLYESHSTFEKEKCFICVNEAGGTDNFENSEVLKTRITENKLHINPKGLQAYEIDNFCDYDMTTNNVNVIKITDSSTRRWFQHECSSYYLGNVEFFNDYKKNIINNNNALRQIYDYLINYDWKDVIKSHNFQDVNYKPDTYITKQVKQCNRDKLIWFYKYLVDEFTSEDDDAVTYHNSDLFKFWIHWCSTNKINIEMNNIQFGVRTYQLCKKIKTRTGTEFITKDTNGKNTIIGSIFNQYYQTLDGV